MKPIAAEPLPEDERGDFTASTKVARLLKSHPTMKPDEAFTLVHREERMKRLGF
jgi:hypothetical protein